MNKFTYSNPYLDLQRLFGERKDPVILRTKKQARAYAWANDLTYKEYKDILVELNIYGEVEVWGENYE